MSSLYVGGRGDDLVRQVGAGRRVAVVANAMDRDRQRGRELQREIDELTTLGLAPVELDLRRHDPSSLESFLAGCAGLWVPGGNTFLLREAMARSGLDLLLPDLLDRDAIAYAGWSAGCCVLAPSLRGIELCDDPREVEREYGAPARYDGLGVLDVMVVPHAGSDECVDQTIRRYDADGTTYVPLRDGEVLLVDGDPASLAP